MPIKITFYNNIMSTKPSGSTQLTDASVNDGLIALGIVKKNQVIIAGIGNNWILRNDWHKLAKGDINIYAVPADPAAALVALFSTVAGNIATATIGTSLFGVAGLGTATVMVSGSMLIGEVFSAAQTDVSGRSIKSASPTYSINGQGNRLRKGEPMAELFGKCRLFPAYAVSPYGQFLNGEQYLYEIFHITNGAARVIKQLLGDTPISSDLDGFEIWQLEPPYSLPKDRSGNDVFKNIYTNKDVLGRELMAYNEKTIIFKPTRWYEAAPVDKNIKAIYLDIIAPAGLLNSKGESLSATVEVVIECQGRWNGKVYTLGVEDQKFYKFEINGNKADPVRQTFNINVRAGVYNVHVVRKDEKDLSISVRHTVYLAGLRAEYSQLLNLKSNATYVARRTKATETSSANQGKYSVVAQRLLPAYNKTTQSWATEQASSSIADAVAYIYRQWLPDADIDLDELYSLDAIWQSRGDTINGIFDTATSAWQAAKKILACGRTAPIRLWDTVTFLRDSRITIPQSLFSLNNIEAGSVSISYNLTTTEMADGIKVFFPNEAKDYEQDSVSYAETNSPKSRVIEIRLPYITNKSQALREAKFRAREQLYRRKQISFVVPTPAQSLLYGSGHLLHYPQIAEPIAQGNILELNGANNTVKLSEPVKFKVGKSFVIRITDKLGAVSVPIKIQSTALNGEEITFDFDDDEITLLNPPTELFANIISEQSFVGNASVFVVNTTTVVEHMLTILKTETQGEGKVKISGFFDDDRVHAD